MPDTEETSEAQDFKQSRQRSLWSFLSLQLELVALKDCDVHPRRGTSGDPAYHSKDMLVFGCVVVWTSQDVGDYLMIASIQMTASTRLFEIVFCFFITLFNSLSSHVKLGKIEA